jgi:hypothetical protein
VPSFPGCRCTIFLNVSSLLISVSHLTMLFTTTHASVFLAVLSSATAWALPSSQYQTGTPRGLEVPWKHGGLSLSKKQEGYSYGKCSHGPQGRECWDNSFDIYTDADLHWPKTGKTVRVGEVCSWFLKDGC